MRYTNVPAQHVSLSILLLDPEVVVLVRDGVNHLSASIASISLKSSRRSQVFVMPPVSLELLVERCPLSCKRHLQPWRAKEQGDDRVIKRNKEGAGEEGM